MIDNILHYSKQRTNHTELMMATHQVVREQNLSSALYRLPHTNIKHQIITFSEDPSTNNLSLEDLPEGFIFTRFNKESIYIKNDLHFKFGEDLKISLNPVIDSTDNDEAFFSRIEELLSSNKQLSNSVHLREKPKTESTTKLHFDKYIEDAVLAIKKGEFEKVVPARCQWIELPENFNPTRLFEKLCNAYPNAMVSMVSTPETGTWIGATPESLVSISSDNIFSTVALAGTQEFSLEKPLVDVAWTQKEIEEQAMVNRYIIDCFKKIRLREFTEKGPRTSKAGNLIHLKTEFTVDMNATNFNDLGSVMLELLHPTSAVCGMPIEPAHKFITKHEDFDRSFFSGYLGPVKIEKETHVFVNLRCMELFDKSALIFAGAGVTEDSNPKSEWNETELKLQTILNLLDRTAFND